VYVEVNTRLLVRVRCDKILYFLITDSLIGLHIIMAGIQEFGIQHILCVLYIFQTPIILMTTFDIRKSIRRCLIYLNYSNMFSVCVCVFFRCCTITVYKSIRVKPNVSSFGHNLSIMLNYYLFTLLLRIIL